MSQPRKDHMQRIRVDEQTNGLLERLAAAYEGNRSACVRQLIRQAAGNPDGLTIVDGTYAAPQPLACSRPSDADR